MELPMGNPMETPGPSVAWRSERSETKWDHSVHGVKEREALRIFGWTIGGFFRDIPSGYVKIAIENG